LGEPGVRLRLQSYELGVYALVQGNLEQVRCVHLIRSILHKKQMRFLIMVSNTHHAGVISDRVGYFNPPIMLYGFVDVNYYVSHIHGFLLLNLEIHAKPIGYVNLEQYQYSPKIVAD
jgi:hypothetical protein